MLFAILGAYFYVTGSDKLTDDNNNNKITEQNKNETIEKVDINTKETFVTEAERLNNLVEQNANNETCKCYDIKELDANTKLSGSILLYTIDDLFITNLWLSDGKYIVNGHEDLIDENIEESTETASSFCGETSKDIQSSLCPTNY